MLGWPYGKCAVCRTYPSGSLGKQTYTSDQPSPAYVLVLFVLGEDLVHKVIYFLLYTILKLFERAKKFFFGAQPLFELGDHMPASFEASDCRHPYTVHYIESLDSKTHISNPSSGSQSARSLFFWTLADILRYLLSDIGQANCGLPLPSLSPSRCRGMAKSGVAAMRE